MSDDPQNRHQIEIGPELLWNSAGMIQQLIMFTLLLVVYVVALMINSRSSGSHAGLDTWLSSLHALFGLKTIGRDLLIGAVGGIVAIVLTTVLDTMIAFLGKKDLQKWMHRTDYLLPRTKTQKRWALAISVTGSIQEEILFRGFIFIALLPIWTHWIWAALILSAFFSLLHANVQGFWSTVWIYLISLSLCGAIALGGSIYMVATAHVIINVSNLFIIPRFFNKNP